MRKARAWDQVKLPVHWWHGARPKPGDGLITSTGRRYLVQEVVMRKNDTIHRKHKEEVRYLKCVVLPDDDSIAGIDDVPGKWYTWEWARRSPSNHRRAR